MNTVRTPAHPTPGWRRTHKGTWHYITYTPQNIMRKGILKVTWLRYVWCTQMLSRTVDPQPKPPEGAKVCPTCKSKLTEYVLLNHGRPPV